MSLETELLNLLAADSAVEAIVGDNMRHEWLDQNADLPGLVITRISTTPDYDLSLNSMSRVRVQIDCFAEGFEEARTLADALTAALHGYTGAAGSYTVDSITLENDSSLGESDGDDVSRRISLDFFVTYI